MSVRQDSGCRLITDKRGDRRRRRVRFGFCNAPRDLRPTRFRGSEYHWRRDRVTDPLGGDAVRDGKTVLYKYNIDTA